MNKNYLFMISAGILLLGLVTFIYHFGFEEEPTPCAPRRYPGRCYHVAQDVCESTWLNSDRKCRSIIQGLSLGPTRLTGPILLNCQVLQMDRSFAYSRKSEDDCDQMHKELIEWSKRNPDF